MLPEFVTRSDLEVFLPPIGGVTVYILGDIAAYILGELDVIANLNKAVAVRLHD